MIAQAFLPPAAPAFASTTPSGTPNSDPTLNSQLINQAWNDINQHYVDRSVVTSQNLTYGAISGMVDALGDTGHSVFLTPDMVAQEKNFTQGSFEGVGLEVSMQNGAVTIVSPIDNSPAQKAGIKAGGIITMVNGEDITSLTLNEVIQKIIGPAGTQVSLTILDPKTNQSKDYTLTRARITLQNVTWAILPGTTIADIRIASFASGMDKDLIAALQAVQQQNATGLVLDLRNDPGGLLDQAISTVSQFESSGTVLEEKDAQGNITSVPVKSNGVALKIPMVVLINKGTASAAEIVTGALQDANRATIVGETTFGTGTVLNEFSPLGWFGDHARHSGMVDPQRAVLLAQRHRSPNPGYVAHQYCSSDPFTDQGNERSAAAIQPGSATDEGRRPAVSTADPRLLGQGAARFGDPILVKT